MKKVILEYQQYSTFKNNVLLISTGINNLNIFKIMAKKIKFYGVFAVKSVDKELNNSKFVKLMTDTLGLPKLQKKQFAVFVFDNELEQVDNMSDIICMNKDSEAIAIDATSREDFLEQVKKLKEKYEEEEAETVEEEQPTTEQKEPLYNAMLTDIINISEKIPTVKAVKEALNIGLKEAKDLVDAVNDSPSILAERVSKLEADRIARFITSRCNCRIAVTKVN